MPPKRLFALFVWVLMLVILMGYGSGLYAQSSEYIYLHLDQEDGLASNDVLAILQDRKGFLWFGTNNGLQRYDGRQFIHYRYSPQVANTPGSDMVEALFEDRCGNIWMASSHIVTRYSPVTHTFTRISLPVPKPQTSSLDSYFVEDEKQQIWLVTRKGRQTLLYQANENAFVTVISPLPLLNLYSTYALMLKPWKSNEAYVYLKDSRGIVWAGSEKLLALYPGDSAFRLIPQHTGTRYGIEYNRIFSLTEDREGTIWAGTDKGVYYFNPGKQRFTLAPLPAQISSDGIIPTDFMEDKNHQLWVSTLNGGLILYDSLLSPIKHIPIIRPQQQAPLSLLCLAQDHRSTIWAGSQDGTLVKIESDGHINYLRPALLQGQSIIKAAVDANGSIWLGTNGGQVFNFDPGTEKIEELPLGESPDKLGRIVRILPQQEPYLWVATSGGGIFKIHKQTASLAGQYGTHSKPFSLLSNQVGDMQWADSTTLAISTIAGLHLLDVTKKTGKAFTTSEGLPANALINVVKGKDHDFYVTPQNGLSRWNSERGKLTNFGARDGLPNAPFISNVSYHKSDGRILLGTMNGFFYFHPDSLAEQRAPADVLITGIKVFDKPIGLDSALGQDGSLRLHHNQNFFTIEYASLNYYDDKQISYYYQLEGIDPGWVKAGPNRFANYTNIEGGSYRFKVKAENGDGTSTIHEAALAIHISHPFWKTWWFRALLILALAGVGAGIYRIRIDRVLALQNMRVQISRDLHDDMGSTLSTINILSAMARQHVGKSSGQTEGHLEKISDYSQRMMDTMDDIVWSVNPLNDAAENLVARMRSFCTESLEPKGIAFHFELDQASSSTRLPLAIKHNCFMIFKEAVNNAAKYAQCKSVLIGLHVQKRQLILSVKDDGAGFDVSQASEGNGLLNMQARAKAMKGTLQIHSGKDWGTAIVLKAPVAGL